jgi:hypothetical protein
MTCEGNANKVLLLYQKERTEERRLRFFSQTDGRIKSISNRLVKSS